MSVATAATTAASLRAWLVGLEVRTRPLALSSLSLSSPPVAFSPSSFALPWGENVYKGPLRCFFANTRHPTWTPGHRESPKNRSEIRFLEFFGRIPFGGRMVRTLRDGPVGRARVVI